GAPPLGRCHPAGHRPFRTTETPGGPDYRMPASHARFRDHYLTRSYSVLPVSAVGSTGIIVRMVLPWSSERLAVPVVRVDRYRRSPSRRSNIPCVSVPRVVEALWNPSFSMTIVARSCPDSALTQPRQLPASSLTSAICFSPATPSTEDAANDAARSRARCHLIADLLCAIQEPSCCD